MATCSATYQVVALQCQQLRLYGELIQTMEERHSCWLRPLALRQFEVNSENEAVFDLQNGLDVICPNHLIYPVMDVEWLQLLAMLENPKEACNYSQANQHLRQFLQALLSDSTDGRDG